MAYILHKRQIVHRGVLIRQRAIIPFTRLELANHANGGMTIYPNIRVEI